MSVMADVILVARLVLAAVFAVAGLAKLRDPRGSRKSLLDFGVPGVLAPMLAVLLPLAELACAVALLFAAWVVPGAEGVAALLALFIAAIAVSLARGRAPDCHCFGQLSSSPVSWRTLVRNAALLVLAVLVAWKGRENPGQWPTLSARDVVEIALAAALAITFLILLHMLKQNGRLLQRLETVETKLGIDPYAVKLPGVPVGDPAPGFRLMGLDGTTLTSEILFAQEQSVLLLFTEPGCSACAALYPEIVKWQREHAERLVIVPVSSGDPETNRAKQGDLQNLGLQVGRETSEAYKVTATPSAVLVKQGKIASPVAMGTDAIHDLVQQALLPPVVKIGEPVPALKLPDLDGDILDLASLRGRRRLVLFWNPSCGFCQGLLEDMKKWERNRPAGAPELLIISSGTSDANRQQGFRSRVLLDSVWGAGQVLGAGGTPSAVLIDEEGRVASEVGVGAPAVLELAGAGK
jgi:peroxiredoxin/uncharacterized membrane protein YphA (DoxX/SURF4 family)